MTNTRSVWIVLVLLYLAFFSWYTSFKGPLTAAEIDHYMAYFEKNSTSSQPEFLASLRKFMEEDTGDDFVMINVIDMYETPLAVEGVTPGESSGDVLDKYMQYMYPELFARASHPILFGSAANTAMDLMNAEGMEQWSSGAGMRYRSRRDMLEISANKNFSNSHHFKVAAMRKTIAFPIDPWFQLGDPRLILALVLALFGCAFSWYKARQ